MCCIKGRAYDRSNLTPELRKLVEDNVGLARKVAWQFAQAGKQDMYEDLFQEGCLALCKAVMTFKPELGWKLSTYAFPFIQHKVIRFLQKNECSVKFSRNVVENAARYNKLIGENPSLTEQEIIEKLGLTSKSYAALMSYKNVYSLDQPIDLDDGEGLSMLDRIPAQPISEDHDTVVDNIIYCMELVTSKLKEPRTIAVIEDYFYSIFFGDKMTQMQLAKKYDCSQAQVSRIIKKYGAQIYQVYKREIGEGDYFGNGIQV